MKKIFYLILIISTALCNAQSPVVDRYNNRSTYAEVAGAYYKDVTNFHNQYVGTWLLNSGGMTFKIIFRKKELHHVTNDVRNFYEDLLVGEYQLIINGVEKVNTLANINLNHSVADDYNLVSITKTKRIKYGNCTECSTDEYRLLMFLKEPSRRQYDGLSNDFLLRKFTENGVEKLKVFFIRTDNNLIYDSEGNPSNVSGFSLPYGNYVLTKQP